MSKRAGAPSGGCLLLEHELCLLLTWVTSVCFSRLETTLSGFGGARMYEV